MIGINKRCSRNGAIKKAKWDQFTAEIEKNLESTNQKSVSKAWKHFKTIILQAAQRHIPRGKRRKSKAWWCEEADQLMESKNKLREKVKDDPLARAEFNEASRKTLKRIQELKAESWREFATSLDPRTEPTKVFNAIRAMDGRRKEEHSGLPLEKSTRLLKTDAAKAQGFIREYVQTSKINISKKEKREMEKQLHSALSQRKEKNTESVELSFTEPELEDTLKQLKLGKTAGPDEISNEMLKHLGQTGRRYLLDLINNSWEKKEIPQDWKKATVIPILKPGKDAKKLGSYRPISLTSCTSKLMERLIQQKLMQVLESKKLLNVKQAGFRSLHSTEDQCLRISQAVSDGFNSVPMKRTVMVLVDFKRAFDTVWKVGLLHKLLALEIPSCYIKWIKQFLSDRQGRVSYGVAKSGYKKFHEGLPQGSVLSPTLFLCFINDITDKLPPNCEVSLFADDLALWTQSSDIDEAESSMQKALDVLENWSKKWKLEINVEKTEVTYFSNDNQEAKHQPYLELFGEVLNYNPYPRFLGVTFDRQLTFNGHIDILVKKVKTRLKIMQTLKGKTWGQNRSDLQIVYHVLITVVQHGHHPHRKHP